ncbi:beta-lactamase family protein (plasmid) [Pseudanabaena biceps]|nr:beta-lactamase family protein [Pseudanabaena biceps]
MLLVPAALPAQTADSAPAAADIAANPDVAAAERLFSSWLDAQIAYRGLPGVAVGVVYDQQLVWSKGFGFADVQEKRPMTAQTRFRIASNSKLFAAIAILQLREAGKLRLDDPVVKHLPSFTMKPARPDDGPITIEQLLSHSAGLQREASDHWSSFDFPSEAELIKLMPDRQAAFPPQTRWKYSNLTFAVAGQLVEKITGQRWADYVQANIVKPLGLTATSIDKPDPMLATPYGIRKADGQRRIMPFVDAKGMASATGVTSTVDDLAKFVSSQFRRAPMRGAEILSAGSWRELLRVRSVDETWQSGSGLGFDHSRFKDRTYVGHGGGYPGNTTQTLVQLDDKVGVIVLTNTNDSNPSDIARQLITTVGDAVAKAAKPTKSPLWDQSWTRFAGLYRSPYDDGITQVVLLNKQLVLLAASASAAETKTVLEPLGEGRFRLMAPTGGGAVGEVVLFDETPGRPARLYLGDTWSERVNAF